MITRFIPFILFLFSFIFTPPTIAEFQAQEFTSNILTWRTKSQIAQSYLQDASNFLREGNAYKACINQRKASEYGVEAFNALIRANINNNDYSNINQLNTSLEKWKALANCNQSPLIDLQ